MGGCAMIGQSMINVKSGGRTRIAGIAAALFLLAFILVGSSVIELIPLAALVGVMFMVVIGTFAWNSLKILRKVPLTDAFVIVLVTVVTVMEDLAVAVVVGVIVSALAYAWNNARRIHAKSYKTPEGARVYQVQGPLFFGSASGFIEMFDVENDPSEVIVDFADSRVVDQSALQAIEALAMKYEDVGKRVQLRHLTHDCHRLLTNAGHLIVDSDDDPDYEIATDYGVRTGILGYHPVADPGTRADDGPVPQPHIVADHRIAAVGPVGSDLLWIKDGKGKSRHPVHRVVRPAGDEPHPMCDLAKPADPQPVRPTCEQVGRQMCGPIDGRVEVGGIAIGPNREVRMINHLVQKHRARMGRPIGQGHRIGAARLGKLHSPGRARLNFSRTTE